VLASLLVDEHVHAILLNERGAEQKMVEMLQARRLVVVRLLTQEAGRDDRQLLVLPPGTAEPVPTAQHSSVFPNVPYEENKYS